MSAPNYTTMGQFPLFIVEADYIPVCPFCGTPFEDDTNNACDICDYTGDPEMALDPFFYDDLFQSLDEPSEELNDSLQFYHISLKK